MNKQELKTARSALKDFYGASTECTWAEDAVSWSKAARKYSSTESQLQNLSPVAFGVYELVNDFFVKVVGVAERIEIKEYYIKHRDYVAEQIFAALEKTLKD